MQLIRCYCQVICLGMNTLNIFMGLLEKSFLVGEFGNKLSKAIANICVEKKIYIKKKK